MNIYTHAQKKTTSQVHFQGTIYNNWALTVSGSDINYNKYRTTSVTAIKTHKPIHTHYALKHAELCECERIGDMMNVCV